jgi:transcriptional regulator with XRE-family HTH domain
MGKLGIGAFIAARRKEKGLTQEELADYLGVSKPAVSKWESGQSYPDITLLPVLAAFFNTTTDALIGYEAQMTKTDIRKLYARLSAAFASESFDKVLAECREYVKKYHACWDLLFAVALLYVNHAMLAGGPDAASAILREASGLLENIERESGDARLAQEALSLRAYCCLALGEPSEAIDLLGDENAQAPSFEVLLAKAYAMKGDKDRARSLLQFFIFKSGAGIVAALTDLMAQYADDPERLADCLSLSEKVCSAFELRSIQPHQLFTLHLVAASLFAAGGDRERALGQLEAYTELVTDPDVYPLKLHGSRFFDLIEPYFESLGLGNSAPRSEKLIKRDMKDAVIKNPAFFCLEHDERFHRLASRLENLK